ncbi:MAG TPA: mechanosensitive ion channel family protein [Kofleriaceae bacterium]
MSEEVLWLAGALAAVLVGATIVNSWAPVYRPRIRRAVVMFGMATLAFAAAQLAVALESKGWAANLRIAEDILRAFVLVNLGSMLVFLVFLPRIGLALPVIVGELAAGVGYLVTMLVVFTRHDMDLTGALATGAVVSAVLAISMQQTLGNILGGIALQLDGSLHEGNWIQLDNGRQAKIKAIRWRHTLAETRDYQTIVIPNAWLIGNQILILGLRDGKAAPQRAWVYFNIDFRFSPQQVITACDIALLGSPIDNVATDPPPSTLCLDFGKDLHESTAYYGVMFFLYDISRWDSTGSRIRSRVHAALQRAGIPLAIPAQMQLEELHDSARAERHKQHDDKAHLVAIKHVSLLRMMTDDELGTLAAGLTLVPFDTGEIITRQGAEAHYLYVLTAGRASVSTKIDPDGAGPEPAVAKVVAELQAPDYFGEMGLMTGEPRSADVVALTYCECFRLDRATFERVLLERPDIVEELAEKLADRRVGLIAARENLDETARKARHEREREHLVRSIKSFFGLAS